MKIAVVGTGYVGLVTGTCFAQTGNTVICVDNNTEKIGLMKTGRIPIYEPGLEKLFLRNVEEKRLSFTSDLKAAVEACQDCDVFLAVGSSLVVYPAASLPELAKQSGAALIIINRTPTPLDGIADLVVTEEIGKALPKLIGMNTC